MDMEVTDMNICHGLEGWQRMKILVTGDTWYSLTHGTETFDETLDVRNPGALELTLPFAMAYQDFDDTQYELA